MLGQLLPNARREGRPLPAVAFRLDASALLHDRREGVGTAIFSRSLHVAIRVVSVLVLEPVVVVEIEGPLLTHLTVKLHLPVGLEKTQRIEENMGSKKE